MSYKDFIKWYQRYCPYVYMIREQITEYQYKQMINKVGYIKALYILLIMDNNNDIIKNRSVYITWCKWCRDERASINECREFLEDICPDYDFSKLV